MTLGYGSVNNWVTVPLIIRNKVNFNTGDTVFFKVRNDEVVIRKPKYLLDYEGFLGKAILPDNEEELLASDMTMYKQLYL